MGELIQRFTYTCTRVSHVIGRSASIYKGKEKYTLNHFEREDENSVLVVYAGSFQNETLPQKIL